MEASRLWKLLTFMDQLLFARSAPTEEGDNASLDSVISHQLHLFWQEAWQELWADAGADSGTTGRKA